MTTSMKPSDAKKIRLKFTLSFDKRSFELVCPKLDSSMARGIKEIKSAVASGAEAKEKMMLAKQ